MLTQTQFVIFFFLLTSASYQIIYIIRAYSNPQFKMQKSYNSRKFITSCGTVWQSWSISICSKLPFSLDFWNNKYKICWIRRLICVGFSIYKKKFKLCTTWQNFCQLSGRLPQWFAFLSVQILDLEPDCFRGASKKLHISELWSCHSTGTGVDTSFQESGIIYWGACAKRITSIQITEEADQIVNESSVKHICKN